MAYFTNYDNGEKTNWRRRTWNRVSKRAKDKKRATVLYLSAEKDLDRRVAVSKGFRPNNLVCVDNDKKIVAALRKQGKLAICDDFDTAVMVWSGPIGVVWGDYCNGLTDDRFQLFSRLLIAPGVSEGTTIMLNMLRGREPGFAVTRGKIQSCTRVPPELEKHRGAMWVAAACHCIVDSALANGMVNKARGMDLWVEMYEKMSPSYDSYRSAAHSKKSNIFDSVVFQWPLASKQHKTSTLVGEKSAKSASAVMAIQTMRRSGKLPASPGW